MTVVASGRNRIAAEEIAQEYRGYGYEVKIEEQYHPHGRGRAFRVITTQDVPRGNTARSGPPITSEQAKQTRELFAALKVAEPEQKSALQLAIHASARGKEYRQFAQPVKDDMGKVIDVITAPGEYFHTGRGSGIGGRYAPLSYESPDVLYKRLMENLDRKEVTIRPGESFIGGKVVKAVSTPTPSEVAFLGIGKQYFSGISQPDFDKRFMSSYESLSDKRKIDYLTRFGDTSLEPGQYIEKQDSQFVIVTPPSELPRERDVWNPSDWWEDPKGTLGGLAADVFMPLPDRITHTISSLQDISQSGLSGGGTQKMKDLWRQNRQIYRQLWETDDKIMGGIRIVSSPFPAVVASYGAGALFSGGFKLIGASGAPGSALFVSHGPIVAGSVVGGVVGADIGYTAAMEEKKLMSEGSTVAKIGTYGIAAYSAYLGSQYHMKPDTKAWVESIPPRMKIAYTDTKSFALGKTPKIKTGLDTAYWTTYKKGLIPGSYSRQVDYRLGRWDDARVFQRERLASIVFGKTKPYLGMYEPSEISTMYSAGSWGMRPEDISFMPHGTKTEFFVTDKGYVEFTSYRTPSKGMMRFGESSPEVWSSGKIYPEYGKGFKSFKFDTGKKGGGDIYEFLKSVDTDFYVSGKSYYKVYAKEGPLATIPSVRENVFYGAVSSKELKIPSGSSLGSDWTASKITGSFSMGLESSSKALVVYNPNRIWKFQGRLVNESLYTESISLTKSFEGGTTTRVGSYGPKSIHALESIETPRFDISYTKTYIPTVSENIGITKYFTPKKIGISSGGFGFDYSTPSSGGAGQDLFLPGGSAKFPRLSYPTPSYMKIPHPQMRTNVSLSYLEFLESGIGDVSSFWGASIPTQKSIVSPIIKVDTRNLSDIVSSNIVSLNIQNVQSKNISISRNLLSPIIKVDSISKVSTKLLPVQQTRVDTRLINIQSLTSITPSITIPSVIKITIPKPTIPKTPIPEIVPPSPPPPVFFDFDRPDVDIDIFGFTGPKKKKGSRKRVHPVILPVVKDIKGMRLV